MHPWTQVSMSDALRWCSARSEHGVSYHETSAKHDIGVEGAFMAVARAALARQAAERYNRGLSQGGNTLQVSDNEAAGGANGGQRQGCKC